MTATSTTDKATATQASHFGTLAPSSDLRMSTRYATATTASTTIAIRFLRDPARQVRTW